MLHRINVAGELDELKLHLTYSRDQRLLTNLESFTPSRFMFLVALRMITTMQQQTFLVKPIFVTILSLGLSLVGCSSGVTGKWINSNNSNDYYELKSDGTWYAQSNSGMSVSGTYEADDSGITLKLANGVAAKAIIKDKVMTTPDGKTYHMQ